jgi:4a-hydroxytetrahydrobiopterin dehydratase
MNESSRLTDRKCKPCEGGMPPLADGRVRELLREVPGWTLENGEIVRTFSFKNYYQTVSFVNAVAWIAHAEDHHPNIEFGYRSCRIRYSTHAIKGLSDNDFICAAKINALGAQL